MLNRIAIVCVVILSFFGNAFAGDVQWNGTISRLWDVAGNWDLNRVPNTSDRAILVNTPGPIIDLSTIAAVNTVKIGGAGGTLDVNGGTLTTSGSSARIDIGYDAGTNGTLTINSGTVTSNSDTYVGYEGTGTINMNGGTLNINGTLGMAYNSGAAVGHVYLYGGTLNCSDLVMAPWDGTARIDITGGTLILNGNKTLLIDTYANTCGWITAYGGAGTVVFDYNVTNPGKTTVTISKVAKNPDPATGVMNLALDKVLHWTACPGIASHDVYLGTDVNAVRDAERLEGDLDGDGWVDYNDIHILANYWLEDPAGSEPYAGVNDDNIVDFADYARLSQDWMNRANPVFKGNQTGTTFDPGTLAAETTYYWRIDEVNGPETIKGDVWNFTTTVAPDGNYTLVGKVMCGYQGWFNCPNDGTSRGWVHWVNDGSLPFSPTNCHVDIWPDMTEMDADEKYPASSFYDGNNYYVFSSHNLKTVRRHFQWMQQYGIDGVYLQRFATEVRKRTDLSFFHRNDVLDYCKDAANMYGRKYAVMYDLTGLGVGKMQSVIDDWKYLVDTKKVTRDPNDHAYMRHRGKPVVCVWGIGWTDRSYTWAECLTLVTFLKDDPTYGGNTVVVGVNDNWRSNTTDPTMLAIVTKADIISPWSVGRYKYPSEIATFTNNVWTPDVIWCQNNSTPSHPIEYLPVIWPGFSWANMHNSASGYPLNQYPRNGGQFLWDQVKATVSTAHANMLYIAMFDEVDEGTAIFKITNNPPRPGGVDMFLTYNMDGYFLPSDEYLWLTGQAGRALRGEISPIPSTRPARP